jgi:hypothetical protein
MPFPFSSPAIGPESETGVLGRRISFTSIRSYAVAGGHSHLPLATGQYVRALADLTPAIDDRQGT